MEVEVVDRLTSSAADVKADVVTVGRVKSVEDCLDLIDQ